MSRHSLPLISCLIVFVAGCEIASTTSTLDPPGVEPVYIRPPVDSPEINQLIEHPSTIRLSYTALQEGLAPQAHQGLQNKAGLSVLPELMYRPYFLELYNTQGEAFGYYLADPDPVENFHGEQNLIVFMGWTSFQSEPLKPMPFIDIELALEHELPYSRWAYGFLQHRQRYTSLEDKAHGLEIITEAAEEGDLDAIGWLGAAYSEGGIGIEQDYGRALQWLTIGEVVDDPASLLGLGRLYQAGNGVEQSNEKAIEYYTRAAEYGLGEAAYRLGDALVEGEIINKDVPGGIFWMEVAARNDYEAAQYYLARLYAIGDGVPLEEETAAYWYYQAAQGNHPVAQYYLARALMEGKGIEKDEEEYRYWLYESAKNDYSDAQNELGFLYETGDGVEKSPEEALYWFIQAADQGSSWALDKVADYYYEGIVVSQSYIEALRLYQQAAEGGNGPSMQRLGFMYQTGRGVPENDEMALHWYERAIKAGDFATSHYNIAIVLYDKNLEESFRHYFVAAEKGDESAVNYLIQHFAEGNHLELDVDQTVKWLKEGVSRENVLAMTTLANMYIQGDLIPQDKAQYLRYITLAAEQNHGMAQYYLGQSYMTGDAVDADLDQASQWLLKAVDNEVLPAYAPTVAVMSTIAYRDTSQEYINQTLEILGEGREKNAPGLSMIAAGLSANGWEIELLEEDLTVVEDRADKGNVGAQFALANLLYKGEQLGQDYERAYELALGAAEQGHPMAQYLVGQMLDFGEGTEQDRVRAYKWMAIAEQSGYPGASSYKEDLEILLTGPELIRAHQLIDEWLERQLGARN